MNRMTTQEVQEYMKNNKDVSIIDVRETEEVMAGKIPGAVHIPLGLIEFRLQDIDKSQEHIMVCRSGNRSGKATDYLQSRGYKVINMDGGMLDWNGPTE
ncbi:rhodanese-like domain-containing protein [Planomicrobium chinense]|uniref:rhodanese-like domain-containing protein n=1 Tax=Planococcus chinensis TaxID=272917 RepID=UPI001CC41037|nr:rhodanese-like domain-containing protein [Planococcus chinensis]MBZ5201766.1 rhodanese-like domain-containing protein [Planococcus chinensis]MCP2034785.1 rhodanese-related sulfurtransferase [Planomicrobium sp. HSC-17F08]